ncbi:AbrB/MazE/SpoVT family DNA-binding domain-containing protein [Bythopirellula goksoeyrii]|uniref:SpoVT-AbrB domain-containing protein n=1 Tax=Bythopirellula goksoeyrii TaxID=1400387 RepID=A0A5B9QG95_9BACT|nr:AbrB/MazE/SpoVT family DNA-binding domain-containing protein [Bythopirellula goksoeyrii]QEG36602.1 hypothetical protein Pr1d_39170 [Bythopirellula goksoeyrii]
MFTVEITDVGDSLGIVFTDEMLKKLGVGKGDKVLVLETYDGLKLIPYDAEFERQFKVAEKVMDKERDVLRKLAEH